MSSTFFRSSKTISAFGGHVGPQFSLRVANRDADFESRDVIEFLCPIGSIRLTTPSKDSLGKDSTLVRNPLAATGLADIGLVDVALNIDTAHVARGS
jgi:hypothetical protein